MSLVCSLKKSVLTAQLAMLVLPWDSLLQISNVLKGITVHLDHLGQWNCLAQQVTTAYQNPCTQHRVLQEHSLQNHTISTSPVAFYALQACFVTNQVWTLPLVTVQQDTFVLRGLSHLNRLNMYVQLGFTVLKVASTLFSVPPVTLPMFLVHLFVFPAPLVSFAYHYFQKMGWHTVYALKGITVQKAQEQTGFPVH
jgi:hypothetical protein